jgi:hypothetical protein
MTTFAAQPETERRLAELDARTRSAWSTYREELRDLTSTAYDDAEAAAWDQLQAMLSELASERAALVPPPPPG